MMNINKKTIRIMLLAVALLSIAVGVFRTVILAHFIEPDTGFYVKNSPVAIWFNVAVLAVVAVILVFGFAVRKAKAPEYLDSRSMVVVFTSALCIFMYFSVFVSGLYTIFTSKEVGLFLFAEIALCVPCCFNHVTICSKEIREKNTPNALLAMSEAIFFAVRTVECFMADNTQINASQRTLELIMLCVMMLFFVFEAGFLVERADSKPSVSTYCMAGFATVAFVFVFLVPTLLASLFTPTYELDFVLMDVLDCCIMLFAASRIITLRNQND